MDLVRSAAAAQVGKALFVIGLAWLFTGPALSGTSDQSPSTSPAAIAALAQISEPPELKSAPFRQRITPPAYANLIVNSKALTAVESDKPATAAPALRELAEIIKQAPDNSDLYLIRASLTCMNHADPKVVISDIDKSISLYHRDQSSNENLQSHYALRARMDLAEGDAQKAIEDLTVGLREDFSNPRNLFNDGKVDPAKASKPCAWSIDDFNLLARKLPNDGRPLLFKSLYLEFYATYHSDHDPASSYALLEQAAKLSPDSPLPYYYMGRMHVSFDLGGQNTHLSARCLDWVTPRSAGCLALDDLRNQGVREFTASLAIDPKFAPAYAERAEAYFQLKEYPLAIRDYTDGLALQTAPEKRATLYGDRGLSKYHLHQYAASLNDLTQAINLECDAKREQQCYLYENRADAYAKMGNYASAIADVSKDLQTTLGTSLLMGISQFRRIYPEYDALHDDVLTDLIRRRFFPQMTYATFVKSFLIDAKGFDTTVLADLYIKRGELYAKWGKPREAQREYARVMAGFPTLTKVYFTEVRGHLVHRPDNQE